MSDRLVATVYCLSVTAERLHLLLRFLIRALRKYLRDELGKEELLELLDEIETQYYRVCETHLCTLDKIAEVIANE
ncbi:MAG: hypothetical protein ACXQS5_06700 [Candidatus Methanospirareceae archaeon]